MNRSRIVGFGVLCYDVLIKNLSEKVFLGGRAGGSTANFLSNCARRGLSCTFAGAVGEDHYGTLALKDLRDSGVSVESCKIISGKHTRIIFEILGAENELELGMDKHSFKVSCPCCGHSELSKTVKSLPVRFFDEQDAEDYDIIYFDSMSRNRARFLDDLRSRKRVRAVLDLGRIGYTRYMNEAELLSLLKRFDLIFCGAVVMRSILKRTRLSGLEDLSKALGGAAIIVSDGKNGVKGVAPLSDSEFLLREVAAPQCEVVDPAGAGDAFLSAVVAKLISLGWVESAYWEKSWLGEVLKEGTNAACEVLENVGARGHLDSSGTIGFEVYAFLKDIYGESLKSIRDEYKGAPRCPICSRDGSLGEKKTKNLNRSVKVYLKNVDQLFSRMGFSCENPKSYYEDIIADTSTAVIVGTGGSFPVAQFLADLFSVSGDSFAVAMHPMQFVQAPRRCDTLFLVSYSGNTPDCEKALTVGIAMNIKKIVVVTGNPRGALANKIRTTDRVMRYDEGGEREKGFVSIRGTVLPCSWFLMGSKYGDDYIQLISWLMDCCVIRPSLVFADLNVAVMASLERNTSRKLKFDVYGTGFAMSAMSDFESKITEGGIGYVRLHESKDFSHGRFISVMDPNVDIAERVGVIFCIGEAAAYERKLAKALEKFQRVVLIESKFEGMLGALELLVLVQYLVRSIGLLVGKDISRPSMIPKAGLSLYKWKGDLR